VLVGFVPVHAPPPVKVSVAVKLPLIVVGVKVASAGFAFCVQFPRPPPPLHALAVYVPLAVAAAIAIGVRPEALQRFILAPAFGTGVCDHDMTRVLVGFVPAHAPLPVTVKVAVNDPFATVGVNTALAGLAFWVHPPRPPPPDHVTAL
jgi:hypothetical protein